MLALKHVRTVGILSGIFMYDLLAARERDRKLRNVVRNNRSSCGLRITTVVVAQICVQCIVRAHAVSSPVQTSGAAPARAAKLRPGA